VPKLTAWFEKHVIGDTPPPIDDTRECGRALDLRVGRREGDMPMCENIADTVGVIAEDEASVKKLKARLQLNKNKLKLLMGPVAKVYNDDIEAALVDNKGRESLDQKAAMELLDELSIPREKYMKRGSPYVTLRIKDHREKSEEKKEVSA
jgi:hypothetical protein